ncbi:SEC10/PgrA surface exclusion domain-containing protein [Limosilactobacillus sp.]|jgi:SEC10/PgrA surface exclusion-like protein|uniref:SEC10/PgrA surface exclusion domain-containing protein n=1 Tax=Limosilactobacillus sp. TaxID=2773925 RepID=UPI0025BD6176|nr:SEC10/PgrA surface exclusion domain-containing protein [Limosilactobacillus sp.]MCH3922968.1 SEC10/PgrA surface exclusion domain-containing protein [Limosilactobacillus sp.]MCH3927651.1 SEC10/PgrA surface exclusion domain-containing protein [Limosilactobacillus sp.]
MSKEHKKLYKAGKNWLTATITVAAMMLAGGMATQSVKADTTTTSADTQLVQAQQPTASQDDADGNQSADTQSTQQDQTTTTSQTVTDQKTSTSDLTVSQAKANAGNQWTHFDQGWSYTDGQGNWVYNQWQRINNNWYYFNDGGYAQTGWYKSGAGNWYHFDDQNAWANTGWQNINNNWYYFDNQNAWALTGWQKINNHWYYFDPTNAWADRGWFQSGAGNWFYFDNQNAWALTGWQKINNRWYYFDPTNAWADRGWFKSGTNWYYFDNQNAWALTGWQRINNRWYYFDQTNAWALKGWQKINNQWYYFDNDNVWMVTGTQAIGDKTYTFNDNGQWTGESWDNSDQSDQNTSSDNNQSNNDQQNQDNNQDSSQQNQGNNDQDNTNQDQNDDQAAKIAAAQKQVDAAEAKYQAASDRVDADWGKVNDAQSQVSTDQDAFDQAKEDLEGIQTENKLTAPQEWINAWKGILSKEKNVSFLSNKDQTIASEYQALLSTNQKGRDMNFNSWKDNPNDKKIPVTFNADSTLSEHDATIATQYAAHLLNQMRAQLGTPLYQITKGSVAISQETAKLYLKDNWSIWNKHNHDFNELNTVLPKEWGVNYVCESLYGGYEKVNNLNDLKRLVYDAVVYLLFEGDHSDSQFGHATDLLGIRLNSDLNYLVQGEVLGVSVDSKNGLEVHFNSIANPNGSRVKQQVQMGIVPEEANPSSKINQSPYNEEISIPDYKTNPADIPSYKQAFTDAQNKLTASQNSLKAAKDQLQKDQDSYSATEDELNHYISVWNSLQ